ncbi:DUF2846 domain-containing protein [Spirosoma sp.]|uniref:DUF2846 domain-containing protein n=1 Tax=Spirosoma sp. TaxID=1899569 RepID=UPI003B3A5535
MRPFVFALLMGLWAGNVHGQPIQTEPAQLILYREKEFISGLGKAYPFKVNDQKRGKLSPNRYVQLALPPGRVKLEFSSDYFSDSQPLWIRVQAGQTYYVKAAVEVDFMSAQMIMAPVDAQQAREELRRMKPEAISPSEQPD